MKSLKSNPILLVSFPVDAVVDPPAMMVQVLDAPIALLAMPHIFKHHRVAQRTKMVELPRQFDLYAGLYSVTSCSGSSGFS